MLPSGLPEDVDDGELLSRFLTSDSQFSRSAAKASAFMPGPTDEKTSVFRQAPEPFGELWATADREIAPARRVRAVAVLKGAQVRQAGLDVEASEPPLRHANIIGWPSDAGDPDMMRAQRKARALRLAQAAMLIVR